MMYTLNFHNLQGQGYQIHSESKTTLELLGLMLQKQPRIMFYELFDQEANRLATWDKPKDNPHYFPKLVAFVLTENVKLHLRGCKVTMFQNGKLALVNPIFGAGIYGYFNKTTGEFFKQKGFTEDMHKQLLDIEERGGEAVRELSKLTGHCCLCGRTLTNDASIEEGIGPICSGKLAGF